MVESLAGRFSQHQHPFKLPTHQVEDISPTLFFPHIANLFLVILPRILSISFNGLLREPSLICELNAVMIFRTVSETNCKVPLWEDKKQ